MDILLDIVQYIINLGAPVFLPIVMITIGIIFRLKPTNALKAGLLLGVAFTAVSTFTSYLLVGEIAPAAQEMMSNTGSNFEAIDVGWTAASLISWAWPFAASMFPLQIIINLIMMGVGLTGTLNVDLWNVWQKIFAGAVTYILTGNLWLSYLVAIIAIIAELKIGDYMAIKVQESTGIPDVTCTHGGMLFLLPVMPIIWLIDRIPGLKDKVYDADTIQKKIGSLGEPSIIGLIMGFLIGVLAGWNISESLQLAIKVATVIVVLPKLASLFSEALMPISEAATSYMRKRFPDRNFYIGLDWPILTANPAVITTSILLIPVLILLAVILPGNTVMPFGDVANFASMIIGAAVIFRGDIVKTALGSIPILIVGLYSSSMTAGSFTQLAADVGFEFPEGASQIAFLKAGPIIWGIFTWLQGNIIFAIGLAILFVISFIIIRKFYAGAKTLETQQ